VGANLTAAQRLYGNLLNGARGAGRSSLPRLPLPGAGAPTAR